MNFNSCCFFRKQVTGVNKLSFSIAIVAVFLCSSASAVTDSAIEWAVTVDFYGKYIWRGQNLSDDPVIQPAISATYDKYYWGTDQSKLNDLTLSAFLPMEAAGGWTITPSLNYVTLVNDDLRDTDAYGTSSDFFFVGISLSKSF